MKKFLIFIAVFCATTLVRADNQIWLPNIPGYATGSKNGSSNALDVNVVNPNASPIPVVFPSNVVVDQGSPGPSASPWPMSVVNTPSVLLPSPLPSGSNHIGSVDVDNFPVPSPTLTIEGTVNQGSPGPSSSPWPVAVENQVQTVIASPLPSGSNHIGSVDVDNFPVPSPTITINGTVNQGSPGPSSSPWPVEVENNVHVIVASPLPSGSNEIGSVNISKFGGSSVSIGPAPAASSIPVTMASNQPVIVTQPSPYPSASPSTASISGQTTLAAPANVAGFILEAYSGNTDNLRWLACATSSTSSGQVLEPGRDTGLIPSSCPVSITPVSGTQEYQIQWLLK